MKTIWLSYAWADNKQNDVDYVAQELESFGLTVKLDRWNIQAGKRLWEQIENYITNRKECDGWILYTTTNSLGSEPCREEFAYALDRALNVRGGSFPIIGLFPTSIDNELIPAAIKTRLFVSLNDLEWKERIKSAVEGRLPNIQKPIISPYHIAIHDYQIEDRIIKVIEVRTRAGSWTPSFIGIPLAEKAFVNPRYKYGPKGVYNLGSAKYNGGEDIDTSNQWWLMFASNEVSPTNSIFLMCDILPSKICFGVHDGDDQYLVDLK